MVYGVQLLTWGDTIQPITGPLPRNKEKKEHDFRWRSVEMDLWYLLYSDTVLLRTSVNLLGKIEYFLFLSYIRPILPFLNFLCCCSVTKLCPTLCDPMDCSMPGFPVLHHLPECAQTHAHWVGGAIQPLHLLLPPSPPAFSLSQHQGLFQWVGSLCQVAKILELQYSGLISFRIDWLDLLYVQGTVKSLLQHHSSKASVLRCSAFFMVQSHFHTRLLEKP